MVAHKYFSDVELKNVADMRPLTLINTLEYYDVPQILTATDATGTNYLCTLFKQTEDGYQYLGVQISEPRLMAFIGGQLDLRDAYLHPEVENALYLVDAKQEKLSATPLLQPDDITEEMLPEAGYFFDADDLVEDSDMQTDTYQLEVPAHDRITFSTLMSRMGWRASSIRNAIQKVAVL
jgi:hypothetical protein